MAAAEHGFVVQGVDPVQPCSECYISLQDRCGLSAEIPHEYVLMSPSVKLSVIAAVSKGPQLYL